MVVVLVIRRHGQLTFNADGDEETDSTFMMHKSQVAREKNLNVFFQIDSTLGRGLSP